MNRLPRFKFVLLGALLSPTCSGSIAPESAAVPQGQVETVLEDPLKGQPVSITESQSSLLLRAAVDMQERRATDQQRLSFISGAPSREVLYELLRSSTARAMSSVSETKGQLTELSDGAEQKEAVGIYCADILNQWSMFSTNLEESDKSTGDLTHEMLSLYQYSSAAYTTVARTGYLTFDLTVESKPPEARIFLRRDGDENWDPQDEFTNTTIKNLIRATWHIRVEKEGYATSEKKHNPFREEYNKVRFDLEEEK